MADVFFGYVYDFGPEEEWIARRGEGAWLDGRRLPTDAGERRGGDGRLELLGIESADPRWIREAADALAERAYRLRALGTIASTLCQVAAARLDGMVTLRRCRAVDAAAGAADRARGRRARRVPGCDDAARRAARPRAALAVVAARTERGARPSSSPHPGRRAAEPSRRRPATLDAVIDWKLATTVAEGIAGPQARARGRPPSSTSPARPRRAPRLVSAYTGLHGGDAAARRAGRPPAAGSRAT